MLEMELGRSGFELIMTVTADKSALAELVENLVAMGDLCLIFGIVVVLIITYKVFEGLRQGIWQ